MNVVVDPSILFISTSEWVIEEKRDMFLDKLYTLLGSINSKPDVGIYWDDFLESYLWEYPQLPPWRVDKDWKNVIVPAIMKLLHKNINLIEGENSHNSCNVTPEIIHNYGNDMVHQCFLKLMHKVIDINEDVFLCLGSENNASKYTINCNCHEDSINPKLIKKEEDFLCYIDIENACWPTNKDNFDEFHDAIFLARDILFKNKEFKCEFKFSSNFMKSIFKVTKHRMRILEQITKRLTLSYQDACANSSLRDEEIKGSNEHRIRVTQRPTSTRIHYRYIENNIIEFLNFYDEGHHDDAI